MFEDWKQSALYKRLQQFFRWVAWQRVNCTQNPGALLG